VTQPPCCVIDQIGQQLTQQPFVAIGVDDGGVQPQINPFGRSDVQMPLQNHFTQLLELHALHRGRIGTARIHPGKRKQLARQLRRTAGGLAQFVHLVRS